MMGAEVETEELNKIQVIEHLIFHVEFVCILQN